MKVEALRYYFSGHKLIVPVRRILIFFSLLLVTILAQAQDLSKIQLSNLVSKNMILSNDTITLDSVSILSSSFIMRFEKGKERVQPTGYWLDWSNARLILKDTSLIGQSVQLMYRVFPYKFESIAYNKSKDQIIQYTADSVYFNPYYYQPSASNSTKNIEWGKLNYSGSFARGVSFGNSQSLSLNSELDLQLTGYIGKDVEITAALTDNNIPIQPDGNTAQIQDFDKVFIQIKKGKHKVIAGDYEVEERESYFLKYYKQLQGASYEGEFDILKDLKLKSALSFSIAKGQFARNTFNGREGNQGPYRLTGSNGETFIIVLAGSEKVYADNVLLQRGVDYDYTMDYNSGEITFTTNYLITKDSRIIVEFEYSDRNYFRTFIQTSQVLEYKKFQVYYKFFNEQDNKNNPINVTLDEAEKNLLREIGDNVDDAFISGVNEVEYDANRVLYKLIDSTVNSMIYDSVFVFSTNEDSARYSLSFTYAGSGMGFYEPDINSANGRVFKWVAPDASGNPTGSYNPVILIITPKRSQMMLLGGSQKINDNWTFNAEVAMSNDDINTFSNIDDSNDRGLAAEGSIRYDNSLGKEKKWKVSNKVGYEFKANNFDPVEPYRPAEFRRDWNLGGESSEIDEHFVYGDTRFYQDNFNFSYRFTSFNRKANYTGYKNVVNASLKKKGWRLSAYASHLTSQSKTQSSVFIRPTALLEKDFKFWKGITLGIGGSMENNKIRDVDSDSLIASSFLNNTLTTFIKSSDSSKVKWKVEYNRRTDKEERDDAFARATIGNTVEFTGDLKQVKSQTLQWKMTYRNLNIQDTTLTSERPDNNVLGRLTYGFNVKRGAIRYNATYELGSGQERQRDYTYLRVQTGDGVYSWIDQNEDAVQQQNEFVVSEFVDSASFIRVFSNFNEFVQTHTSKLDQSLFLNPKVIWNNEKGIKGFLAKFSARSSLLISKQSLKDAQASAFNPFKLSSNENNIIVVNASIRNALYFNRTSSIYKINYIQGWTQNKVLLLNGIDARQNSTHEVSTKWNVKRFLALKLEFFVGSKVYNSEFFDTDDYAIKKYAVESGTEYTWKTKIRTGIYYNYSIRRNDQQFGGEKAKANEVGWDFKFSLIGKSTLLADFKYVNIDYSGESNTTKAYEILEGLRPGQNYIWSVRLDQKLVRNIQLTLRYEGRKAGQNKLVNTGTAQIRALF